MLWFTSDLHFNHRRIIELCGRPFTSVEDMNDSLIRRWNAIITEYTDVVYVLGDFAFHYKDAQPIDEIFHQLNGEKHLVVGNHDEQNSKVLRLPWKSMSQIAHVRYGEARFFACHFPMESWWHMERGVIHVHGHCHGSLQRRVPHRFDVGVDASPFYLPHRATALIDAASRQEFNPTDHHIRKEHE